MNNTKANKKYTALEILKIAGVENPEDKFGKFKIRIAGLRGISSPNHLITIQPTTDQVDILVGDKVYSINTTENEKTRIVTEEVTKHEESKAEDKAARVEDLKVKKAKARIKISKKEVELKAEKLPIEEIEKELEEFEREVYNEMFR